MKIETQMLLANISGLVQQVEREPEKAEECVNMIAKIIARAHRQRCLKCHRLIGRHDKLRKSEAGVTHKNCEWPTTGVTPEEYCAEQGLETFNRMKNCLFGL